MSTKGGHDADFLMRIIQSLGHDSILDLVLATGIPFDDLKELHGSRSASMPVDQSETWQKIAAYADKRIGLLLSVREELQRKLNIERRQRLKRRQEIEDR